MNNKKSTILVAALSLSFVLSTQSVLAVEDQAGQAGYVSETDSSGKSADTDLIFTIDQQIKLSSAGYSPEEIIALDKKAREEKAALGQDFDLDKFVKDKIAEKENAGLGISDPVVNDRVGSPSSEDRDAVDASSSATYYKKANWENKIKDKSRWKVEDDQTLVRVTTTDPVQMNDIDYDGMYINANGRYVIRLIYKEKTQAVSAVWHRALINFGDLDQYIDFSNSYIFGRDGKTKYTFDPVPGVKGRGFDLRSAVGDRTNNRKNLPINLVLKDGVTLDNLPKKNYIVQMRLTNADYKRVYSYAPGKTSMDYSTYTKTTSVSLEDNLNNLFIKGGLQSDSNSATNQEFFMSEFIANPDQYNDKSNLGIIRTQYMGQRGGSEATPTVGGQPIAFTQVFDANLLNYLKEDDDKNVAYLKVLTVGREVSPYSHNIGIKRKQINKIKVGDKELAYVVIGTSAFQKKGVEVVEIPQHDQYTMLSGFYITSIDYVVDKGKFEETYSQGHTRKLDYSTMSGWTNPNTNGWAVYKRKFDNDYVVQEGDSFMVDAGAKAKGKQIMVQVGGEQAILRRPQGYYNGYNSGKAALDNFEEIADGIFKFTIGEGTTVKNGKDLKIYMPYTSSFEGDGEVNFLQIHNGTKLNEGAATLTLQKDRNINMHLYKQGKKGHFVLKYTLADGRERSLKFEPKFTWTYNDTDGVLTGASNKATLQSGGNFYIDTTKLKPGKDIIVESYDGHGNKVDSETSWFKYVPAKKADETVKLLTWTDHSDNKSVLSINKSLYTPYQLIFTNDYADGTDDFYKNPRVLPADNAKFNTDTTSFVGYTKYDGGKIRTLYEGKDRKLYAKVEAAENEYDDKGNLVGGDKSKMITIPKSDIFDAHFEGDNKEYRAYEYTVNLRKMLLYHEDVDKSEKTLELKKDMKFVATASDGSSLPSDLYETRVRTRVLFDANTGILADGKAKEVKIVPDNVKFYGEEGYAANGFEGANVEANTGDKFPENPSLAGKNFLGWVTEAGKTALGNKVVVTADAFNALSKDKIFTNETPITKHLVVYAVYSDEVTVTFDANQGKFTDGKDTTNVKVEGGNVTKPANPTREGFTFKGWADKKDATTPNVTDFSNITSPKTVYAVWEKKADTKLTLQAPTNKVPVQDKTGLTEGEKDKVKEAVIAANNTLGLTKNDITVENDGKVIVNKGGKTGEIPADQTVKQKEVINNINPPAKPVEVKNKNGLTEEEKGKVKDAIIAANPDLNLTKDDITVDETGRVTVKKGGKVGEVPANKTVVEEDKVIKLNAPNKVEVKDVNNLTPTEKQAVEKAVRDANTGKLSNTAIITVDGNGNVTVTDGDKTGKLDGKDTVKPFDRTGKKFNENIEKTQVSDLNNLTEAEKEAVKEAVKTANPDLGFTNDEIQVSANGTVTVPMGTNPDGTIKYETITPDKTVKADDVNTTISLKAPAKKVKVKDPTDLTKEEKKAVETAVKKANTSLPTDAKVEVANDGSVTVTSGNKTGMLGQADTVVKELAQPRIVADDDGKVVVGPKDDRTKEIEVSFTPAGGNETQKVVAKKDPTTGEWKIDPAVDGVSVNKDSGLISIPADKIKNDSNVVAIAKDGENTSKEASVKSNDTQAPANPEISEGDDGNVTITIPKDKDAKTVDIEYKDNNGVYKSITATKDASGTWKLGENTPQGISIEDDKIKIPAEMVKNGTRVEASATDGNNNKSSTVGITTKTDADKTEPVIPAKTKVEDPTSLKEDEIEKVKKAIEDANKDKFPKNTNVDVATNGTATITYPDGSKDTIKGTNLVEKSETSDTKAPGAPKVEAKDNGDVTITPPTDADTKEVEVSYVPTGQTDPVKVKATKDPQTGKWTVPADSGLKVDENGNITIPADKVKDGTEVIATATDNSGNTSTVTDESKAKAKTPSSTPDTTAPGAPKVTAKDNGDVTITPPTDADTKEVEVSYVPTGQTDPVKVKATKDPQTGKWTVPADSGLKVDENGNITIPADKVKDGTEVSAVAKDEAGNASTPTDTSKVKAKTPSSTGGSTGGSTGSVIPPISDGSGSGDSGDADEDSSLKPIDKVEVKDKDKLTDAEKKEIADRFKEKNPGITGVEVDDKGNVTITKKDGTKTNIPAVDVLKEAESKNTIQPIDKVEVKDKDKLTDAEKKEIADRIKEKNPGIKDVEVDDKGNVEITNPDGSKTKISAKDVVSEAENVKVVIPKDKVKVKDLDKLTEAEKKSLLDKVKKANPNAIKVEFDDKGNVVLTFDNGLMTSLPYRNLVTKVQKGAVMVPHKSKSEGEAPLRNRKGNKGARNVKTGVSEVGGLFGVVGTAIAGLFVTRKKEDEEEK